MTTLPPDLTHQTTTNYTKFNLFLILWYPDLKHESECYHSSGYNSSEAIYKSFFRNLGLDYQQTFRLKPSVFISEVCHVIVHYHVTNVEERRRGPGPKCETERTGAPPFCSGKFKKSLRKCGYPDWVFSENQKDRDERGCGTGNIKRGHKAWVTIPYIRGLSENIKNILKEHGVTVFYKP